MTIKQMLGGNNAFEKESLAMKVDFDVAYVLFDTGL